MKKKEIEINKLFNKENILIGYRILNATALQCNAIVMQQCYATNMAWKLTLPNQDKDITLLKQIQNSPPYIVSSGIPQAEILEYCYVFTSQKRLNMDPLITNKYVF